MSFPCLAALAGAAVCSVASADLAGFVAFARNVGSSTVIDVFAAVTSSGDRFLNVYDANVASTTNFVQKAGSATKTWKPDMAGFGSMRATSDDSFMTAGTFGGGAYGGQFFASPNSNADPNFTGTSWTATPTSAASPAVPANAGWYSGDPVSGDNSAESLAAIAGARIDSVRVEGTQGSSSSSAAQFGIWIGHLVVTGGNRSVGDGLSVMWNAGISIKNAGGVIQQGKFKLVAPPPTNVSATDGTSASAVTVTWSAAAGATGYKVFRAVGAGVASQIGTTAAGVLTFTDGSATAGMLYTYSVKASYAFGDSAASASNTGWRNVTPPNPAATDGTSAAHVTVTWATSPTHTGYKVFRGVGSATPTQLGSTLPATTATFNDTTGTPGLSYNYHVKAMTAAGDSALSAANAGWRALAAPASIAAADGASTANVVVNWGAVTGATGYKVFRAIGSGASTQLGTTAAGALTFTDGTATAGVLYTYTVKATATTGDGPAGIANTGWRNVPAPTGIAASDGTFADRVAVTWTASTNTAVTGYRILRKIGAAAETTVGNVTGRAAVAFNDTAIPVGSVGTYRVAALTAAGVSLPSATNTGFKRSAGGMPSGGGAGGASGDGGTTAGAARAMPTVPAARKTTTDLSLPGGARTVSASPGGTPSARGPAPGAAAPTASAFEPPSCAAVTARVNSFRALVSQGDVPAAALDFLLAPAAANGGPEGCVACRLLAGDVTLDGSVGANDAMAWIEAWAAGDWAIADLDRDGWMDDRDLTIVLRARPGLASHP